MWKSADNSYYEIFKSNTKCLNPPIFAIIEQKPTNLPIRKIYQFGFFWKKNQKQKTTKQNQNVIFYTHKIILLLHMDEREAIHVIQYK